jgi:hypothetical protein
LNLLVPEERYWALFYMPLYTCLYTICCVGVSREAEADDGLLLDTDGGEADQGEADVPSASASRRRNGKEVIPEDTPFSLPSVRTYLQVLRILPRISHQVPPPSPSGKLGVRLINYYTNLRGTR